MLSRADECPSDRYWITTARAGERNIKERDGPGGATPNARLHRRPKGVRCKPMLAHLGQLPRLVQQNSVARHDLAAPDDFSVYAHVAVPERLLEVCGDVQVTLGSRRVNRSRGASDNTRYDM
jgi:hypothetical protein